MKQQNDFTGRIRSQERSFFTEAQFLKFAEPRSQYDLTNLVRATPSFSTNPPLSDAAATTEPGEPPTFAKGASA